MLCKVKEGSHKRSLIVSFYVDNIPRICKPIEMQSTLVLT